MATSDLAIRTSVDVRAPAHRANGPERVQWARLLFGWRLMSFGIYIVGYLILIAGLAIGAHLLNVPPQWIGVGVLCLIGVAVVHGATATRQKDTSS